MWTEEQEVYPADKTQKYRVLIDQMKALTQDESDVIANLANAAALLFLALENTNWVGFYLMAGDELVLGPFQGKPACTRIALGRGVCGAAAAKQQTLIVPDVHRFSGHIACDSASNSEIVVPLVLNGRVLGVLDMDSPIYARFDEIDRCGLEAIVGLLLQKSAWQAPEI